MLQLNYAQEVEINKQLKRLNLKFLFILILLNSPSPFFAAKLNPELSAALAD